MSAGAHRRAMMRCARCAAWVLVLASCARGGDGEGSDGGGGARADAGDAGRRDGGQVRDAGPGSCEPRGFSGTCQSATDIGPIGVGERFESELGLVMRATSQWLHVAFPPAPPETPEGGPPSQAGGGTPAIRFLRNDDAIYRIEIRTECVGVASCAEGGSPAMPGAATDLTEWSFVDDPLLSEEGGGRFSTRDTPWPAAFNVRVYPRGDPGCALYQLEITR